MFMRDPIERPSGGRSRVEQVKKDPEMIRFNREKLILEERARALWNRFINEAERVRKENGVFLDGFVPSIFDLGSRGGQGFDNTADPKLYRNMETYGKERMRHADEDEVRQQIGSRLNILDDGDFNTLHELNKRVDVIEAELDAALLQLKTRN